MDKRIKSLTCEELKKKLTKEAYTENAIKLLYDDNVNGERLLQLNREDLLNMFKNQENLVNRLQMLIETSLGKTPTLFQMKDTAKYTTCEQKNEVLDTSCLRSDGNVTTTPPQSHELQAVQICKAEGDTEQYVLDEIALRNILCREDLMDKPVAVYSIAGSFRKGKSFMLNLFIRHLRHQKSPKWLQDKEASLHKGFRCKAGIERCTKGIWIWNEPFLVTDENGKEIVVYLMDTQGTSDLKTGTIENSLIFALSTLISSVQIFNLSEQVEGHDLQLLKLFTDYGRLAAQPTEDAINTIKPFQSLIFLIRDWNDTDYEDGMNGGRKYLEKVLEVSNENIEELRTVRKNIKKSFNDVECFLMPEPGKKIAKGGAKVEQTLTIGEIDDEFLARVDDFVRYLFHERIAIKQVNGEHVTGNDLLNLVVSYCNAFSCENIPNVEKIYEANTKAAIQKILKKATSVYFESLDEKLKRQTCCFREDVELKNYHDDSKEESIIFFDNQKKMGNKTFLANMKKQLEKILESNFKYYQQKNNKEKALAKQFWIKEHQKISRKYFENMKNMWKPNEEDVNDFSSICDRLCRAEALKSLNQLLKDYPKSFVEECKIQLETNLNNLLDYIKKHFIKKQVNQTKRLEDAKLTVKSLYVEDMNQRFDLRCVEDEQIEKSHKECMKKALDHFNSLPYEVSEKFLVSSKAEAAFEIDQLKEKYLEDNKNNKTLETKNLLKQIEKAVERYKTSMNMDNKEHYIREEDLKQKHKVCKSQALNDTCKNKEKEFYDKYYQGATARIASLFSNIQSLNTNRKSDNIQTFYKQAEVCLQDYKNKMQEILKAKNKKISDEEFLQAHHYSKDLLCSNFCKTFSKHEPKQVFEDVYKKLEDDITEEWKEIQKHKQVRDKVEADLALETAVINCLNIMKELMNGRHIKETALQKLYKQAKSNRDLEFVKLEIPKRDARRESYNKKFEKHYEEICEKNKENKYTYLQINYDPFEDVNRSWCPIS